MYLSTTAVVQGFKEGMAEQGFASSNSIKYFIDSPISMQDIDGVLEDVLESEVDLIFSMTTPFTKKVVKAVAGTKIPVVFGPVYSPQKSGIVQSLRQPGGNVTGVRVRGSTGKALEWFKKVNPAIEKVYVPFQPSNNASLRGVEDLKEIARKINIEVMPEAYEEMAELNQKLAFMPEDVDGIFLISSNLYHDYINRLGEVGFARKIPVISSTHQSHGGGVMLSYGKENFLLGKQVSRMAGKILKGISPADLPVETADFFLKIDLSVARKIEMTIPDHILQRANIIVR